MRLLHTADLHLGSPLRVADAPLRRASDGVLSRIVDLALAEQVDALVIAGDILDRHEADLTLRARLAVQLRRAVQGGVPVVMIRGNHDALMDYDRFGPLGDGIHLLTRDRPTVVIGEACFHGLSFEGKHEQTSQLPRYPAAEPGRLNIGVMHTSLGGSPGHDPYAPVAQGALLSHGYDYWALGHIHQRSEVIADGVALVMPGIPQGRHAGETGLGSVTRATLGGMPDLKALPVAEIVFETQPLDLSGLDQGDMIDAFRAAVAQEPPYRMIRFHVRGTDLPSSALEEYAQAALEDMEHAELEALRVDTRPPLTGQDDLMQIAQDVAGRASFHDEAARLLAGLRDVLPRDIQGALSEDQLEGLIEEGLAELGITLRGTSK